MNIWDKLTHGNDIRWCDFDAKYEISVYDICLAWNPDFDIKKFENDYDYQDKIHSEIDVNACSRYFAHVDTEEEAEAIAEKLVEQINDDEGYFVIDWCVEENHAYGHKPHYL